MSGLTISQAIYEAALIIAVLRWVLFLVFRIIKDRRSTRSSLHTQPESSSSSSSSWESLRDNPLLLTTFGEIVERLPETDDTCVVCLNQLRMEDEVRELMNCYHVFHRECIDRWVEHDHHHESEPTCPLCRAPLVTPSSYCLSSSDSSSSGCLPPPNPSWAVERLLYLFGDDLLQPCY